MSNLPNSKYLITLKETMSIMNQAVNNNDKLFITALNINILHKINHDVEFDNLFSQFDKISFDGYYSIIWAKAVGIEQTIKQISADILMKEIFSQAEDKKWSICALGGSHSTEQEFTKQVNQSYPNVDISYHHHGYFTKDEEEHVINEINHFSPDILMVGLSVPKEHQWCIRNKSRLNAKIILTCGGYIEQTSEYGVDYYPSHWIYKLHINWIYRIINEPSRLWKRYFFQGLWLLYWLPWQFIQARLFKKNLL
ncbi:MAG: WecB/TagA/CpsF family glycosyltransferase [Desulfobacula sp.]|uniref:WecB/TagA/CpsF family glycosyltransferase n=1 Tax=Desulfobacula sp. TaxID=2593537 RepID=UPI0025BE68D5|nr:WecB/TagA/CpsF family glycosyltransferase [Desulfobacula sp.]MCD4720404.1 WecB/TagA/CpsF family glycosyltransferase [Desulfobacula sp.]